ncbi:LOW QUALITY PROTEIN: protein SPHAR, partial [Suricata suricatta]|uniref:LOW QUALITY PROTEIN: protein SPHAR n=1 Tax=Suricata suricatta TaxID=37032 RepID=UPI0011558880
VCICFRHFNFAFFYAWNILFRKIRYEANSQTELLLGPWKNVRFSVSSTIVLQAAHF